jgi:hypothetical protein
MIEYDSAALVKDVIEAQGGRYAGTLLFSSILQATLPGFSV